MKSTRQDILSSLQKSKFRGLLIMVYNPLALIKPTLQSKVGN